MKYLLLGILFAFVTKSFAQDFFKHKKFRLIGPFRGGRSAAVAGELKNRQNFYMGTTGGGVWKTTDGGNNWQNISDKYFGGSIGAVALAPSDNSIIYVGEGENTFRGNVSEGINGMWRSNDGGRTWNNIGLKDARHITRIIIHPKDPNIVWVTATGSVFGPSNDRGVYKTIDGGKNWRKVLFSDAQSGAIDLVMEPNNPNVFYASTWTVIRTPYSLESGGKGSALWKSVDGGETWQNISAKSGFPAKGILGIIGIAVAQSNPERVYAIIEASQGKGLYKSNDAGETWELVSSDPNILQRSWYFHKIFVDPKNADIVYALNVGFYKSVDGGKNFKPIRTPHGDHHDLWIDPEDGNRMIIADDGGAQVSFDGGNNWSTYMNQPTSQIYRVSTDNHYPYRILGAQQDNSTIRILSQTSGNAISDNDWSSTAGFESGYVVADPKDPNIVYGGNYSGYLSKYNHTTGENKAISVWPDDPLGSGADVMKYRFQWNFPIFFSPHNPNKLYCAAQYLFVTTNEGASWERISDDLTTNDKTKQAPSGGPITKDNTGVEVYCTIFTATESELEKDLLWTGSDDGLIHVSRDGGKNWKNVTPPKILPYIMWNCVETDPFKKGTAYFVGTRYKLNDFTPYIFKTEDYGNTWKKITNGINGMHFTRCLRADKKVEGILYAGTEYGLYISYDSGNNWQPFQLNLPIVPITDLAIKNNDLVVATQGRAFWVLDDLSLIQQKSLYKPNTLKLFNIAPVYRYDGVSDENVRNKGFNPKKGTVLNFNLPNFKETDTVYVKFYDSKNNLVKSFSNFPLKNEQKIKIAEGMNSLHWNLHYDDGDKIDGMVLWAGNIEGHKAFPGKYKAVLQHNKNSDSINFEVLANPLYKVNQKDYEAQEKFITEIKNQSNKIIETIRNIRSIRNQINDFSSRMGKKMPDDTKKLIDSVNKKITAVEEALYQTKAKSPQDVLNYPIRIGDKINNIYNYAMSADGAPTQQAELSYRNLKEQADKFIADFENIQKNEITQLNKDIWEKKLMIIAVGENKN